MLRGSRSRFCLSSAWWINSPDTKERAGAGEGGFGHKLQGYLGKENSFRKHEERPRGPQCGRRTAWPPEHWHMPVLALLIRVSECAKPIDVVWRCPGGTSQEEERLSPCKVSPAPRKACAGLALPPQASAKGSRHRQCQPGPCATHSIAASTGIVLVLYYASGRSCLKAFPVLPKHSCALPRCLDPLVPSASIHRGLHAAEEAGVDTRLDAGEQPGASSARAEGAGGLQADCHVLHPSLSWQRAQVGKGGRL